MRVLASLVLAAVASACTATSRAPDPAACAEAFARYDTAVRVYGTPRIDEDFGLTPPAPLSRYIGALRSNGCLTFSDDLDAMDGLAARLAPYTIDTSGPAIRATPVHLGIVTGIGDEARVTHFFRGLGYRSRGIGAEGRGRRIYIGPFTTQGGLDQALAVAREAGFIAPYAATHTRF
jgi:hypothetical protein